MVCTWIVSRGLVSECLSCFEICPNFLRSLSTEALVGGVLKIEDGVGFLVLSRGTCVAPTMVWSVYWASSSL